MPVSEAREPLRQHLRELPKQRALATSYISGVVFRFEVPNAGLQHPCGNFKSATPADAGAQKGNPAKRTGHTLRVAPQYSQKSPENNALFQVWLAEFR
jgi:hypothetical protein